MQEKHCWLDDNDREISISSDDDSAPATPQSFCFEDSPTHSTPPNSPSLLPTAITVETGKYTPFILQLLVHLYHYTNSLHHQCTATRAPDSMVILCIIIIMLLYVSVHTMLHMYKMHCGSHCAILLSSVLAQQCTAFNNY